MSWRDDEATFAQRKTLFGMRQSLGQSTKGIRNMTKGECSDAISKAKVELDTKKQYLGNIFDPDSVAAFETEETLPSEDFYGR